MNTHDTQENTSQILEKRFGDKKDQLKPLLDSLGIDSLMIYLTNQCPFNCAHCYMDSTPSAVLTQIHTEEMLRLMNGGAGERQIIFSGGEISLHPDAIPLIKYAAKSSEQIIVFTTGINWIKPNKLSTLNQQSRISTIQSDLLSVISEFPQNVDLRFGFDIFHLSNMSKVNELYKEIIKALLFLKKEDSKYNFSLQTKYTNNWKVEQGILAQLLGLGIEDLRSLGAFEKGGIISRSGRAKTLDYDLNQETQLGTKKDTLYVGNLYPTENITYQIALAENSILTQNQSISINKNTPMVEIGHQIELLHSRT